MTGRSLVFVASLMLAVVASGVWVVYVKYLTRIEFSRLQTLTQERHRLEEDWGMLQL